MDTGTGYYGHVAVTAGIVRGIAPLDPVLEIQLKIQADGFAPGVAAMILASAQVRGATLSADLGKAETIITQLGFPFREDGDTPYKTSEFARWHLTQAGVEHLERVRDGGNLALSLTPEVVLLNHGESVPGAVPQAGRSPPAERQPAQPDPAHRAGTARHPGRDMGTPGPYSLAAGRRRHSRRKAPRRNSHRRSPHRDPGSHRRTAASGRRRLERQHPRLPQRRRGTPRHARRAPQPEEDPAQRR